MISVHAGLTGIDIKGHAHYAPQGEDIVCAAASILAMTLLDICEDAEIRREDGHISIKHGDPAAILFARRGYKLLADAYPGFVEVI